jgi:hypothetical protein
MVVQHEEITPAFINLVTGKRRLSVFELTEVMMRDHPM